MKAGGLKAAACGADDDEGGMVMEVSLVYGSRAKTA